MHTFAVRHGIPEHNRYVIDPTQDPGLAQGPENQELIDAAGNEIATRLPADAHIGIVTSPANRAIETGIALADHPLLQPYMQSDRPQISDLLAEGAVDDSSDYGSLKWIGVIYDLARVAFNGREDGKSTLILVTHDSVINQIPHLKGKNLKPEYLGVNYFRGNSPKHGFNG